MIIKWLHKNSGKLLESFRKQKLTEIENTTCRFISIFYFLKKFVKIWKGKQIKKSGV